MSILIGKDTNVLVQGATGKEGRKAIPQMISYGTKVLAGVTPGKGGQEVEEVPVFETVAEALRKFPKINTSFICVPKMAAKDAILESISQDIPLINILTEHLPISDAVYVVSSAKERNIRIVGPSSIGIISPGKAKLGSIGGGNPHFSFMEGRVGVISKSGGMASEVAHILKKEGIGQSTVIGIGGDMIIGSNFVDLLELFEKDKNTKAVVLFGEHGGTYEEEAAEYIKSKKFKKPVVAFISGLFAETLPHGQALGHAGAIIEAGQGHRQDKVNALESAGVSIAEVPDELPKIIRRILTNV